MKSTQQLAAAPGRSFYSYRELAEELVSGAIARRSDGHDDDVTVLVLQLKAPERPLDCECA